MLNMKNVPEEIRTASHFVVFVNAVATPLVVVNWIGPKQVAREWQHLQWKIRTERTKITLVLEVP